MKSKIPFTKKDIIVFLACIVFLLANLGLIRSNGREHAKQMVCATNIRQLLSALTIHANENDGWFPENTVGYWLWDLDTDTCNIIIEYGATKDTFYCPSNRQQKRHRDEYWNYSPMYKLTSYFWNLNNSRIDVNAPAEFELIIDATISDPSWPKAKYPNGNFEKILLGGMASNPDVGYDSSNHIKSPQAGLGGNIGFVDGHVEWRDFEDMMIRKSSGPLLWW